MSEAMVFQARGLRKSYAGRTVVDIESLEVRAGELFVIVGPSGAGKSTFLRLLHFLESPTSGELLYHGERVEYPAPVEIRRQIGMVFQRPELLSDSVWDNVCYPLRLRGLEEDNLVEGTLKHLDLLHLAQAPANTLSGGEAQRVALARTLVTRPQVLMLDEPTANLDPYNVELIEMILRELHAQGTTVVLVTHNVFQARRVAERVGLMLAGRMVEVSEVETFFENPSDERALAYVRGQMVY